MAEQHIHADYDCMTGETTYRALTAEEIAEIEAKKAQFEADRETEIEAAQILANLKASAKAKLIAGEPLTVEEAESIVF